MLFGAVPGGIGSVSDQHSRVASQWAAEYSRNNSGGTSGGVQNAMNNVWQRQHVLGHLGGFRCSGNSSCTGKSAEQPRAHVHRRGCLEYAEHVVETLRSSQVQDEECRAETSCNNRCQPG